MLALQRRLRRRSGQAWPSSHRFATGRISRAAEDSRSTSPRRFRPFDPSTGSGLGAQARDELGSQAPSGRCAATSLVNERIGGFGGRGRWSRRSPLPTLSPEGERASAGDPIVAWRRVPPPPFGWSPSPERGGLTPPGPPGTRECARPAWARRVPARGSGGWGCRAAPNARLRCGGEDADGFERDHPIVAPVRIAQ